MTAGRASLSIDLEVSMTGETKESWMEFCEQAANGQDPKNHCSSERNQSPSTEEARQEKSATKSRISETWRRITVLMGAIKDCSIPCGDSPAR